jgi:translocator protein
MGMKSRDWLARVIDSQMIGSFERRETLIFFKFVQTWPSEEIITGSQPMSKRRMPYPRNPYPFAMACYLVVVVLAALLAATGQRADAFAASSIMTTRRTRSSNTSTSPRITGQQQQPLLQRSNPPPLGPLPAVPAAAAAVVSAVNNPTTASLVVFHVLGGALGAPVVGRAVRSWYRQIDLPPWTPPDRLFAPVWTILYATMGVAVARVVNSSTKALLPWYRTMSLQIWAVHYVLNILWAPVFFGYQRFRTAATINFALLATLAVTVYQWWQVGHYTSCYLLLPYGLWLSYATALNVAICRRNPGPYNTARFVTDLAQLQREAARYAGL